MNLKRLELAVVLAMIAGLALIAYESKSTIAARVQCELHEDACPDDGDD